ncbi:hypothetical protein D3C87_1994190 [compost metagenome]
MPQRFQRALLVDRQVVQERVVQGHAQPGLVFIDPAFGRETVADMQRNGFAVPQEQIRCGAEGYAQRRMPDPGDGQALILADQL